MDINREYEVNIVSHTFRNIPAPYEGIELL
jgi:hypothetical protein